MLATATAPRSASAVWLGRSPRPLRVAAPCRFRRESAPEIEVPTVTRQVFTSTVIDAELETVWTLMKDFKGTPKWHPLVRTSSLEKLKGGAEVGAVRELELIPEEGSAHKRVHEKLLAVSDPECSLEYAVMPYGETYPEAESPFSSRFTHYTTQISLRPVTSSDSTYVEWKSQLTAESWEQATAIAKFAVHFQEEGLHGLQRQVGRAWRPSPEEDDIES